MPIWRRFEMDVAFFAESTRLDITGMLNSAKEIMMAITTSISTKVNASAACFKTTFSFSLFGFFMGFLHC